MNKIQFPSKDGYYWLDPKNIASIQTEGEQSIFYLIDDSTILCLLKVSECADLLKRKGFFMVNRATLINLRFVFRFINGNERRLILDNDAEFIIPRRRKDVLLAALKKMTQK